MQGEGSVISDTGCFAVFVLVSLVAFVAILRFVTRHRVTRPRPAAVLAVAGVVVVGGMLFAKFGNNAGLPRWIYTVPALAALAVPPATFAFSGKESIRYLMLAFLSSPTIHVVFSFLLGWHEYMPFIPVPSLQELFANVPANI